MSSHKKFADINISVGELDISRVTVCGVNTYIQTQDLSKDSDVDTLFVCDRVGIEGTSKDLKDYCIQYPDELAKLISDATAFPLKYFESTEKEMDAGRVIDNIEALTSGGSSFEHALSRAVMAEYGLSGDKANEFCHSKTFAGIQKFLENKFPNGPKFKSDDVNTSLPGEVTVRFGASTTVSGDSEVVSGTKMPPNVDMDFSAAILKQALQGPKKTARVFVQ